jgi:lipopolysaccharide transport system permease protein
MRIALFQAIWAYRGFVTSSIQRDFQQRYTGSVLGVLWNILNPLAQIVVFTVIFAEVMRARLPELGDDKFGYSLYICAGQLTWLLFTEIISRMQNVFVENANLLKKSSFPRICLPVIVVGSALLNFAVIFGLFLAFLLVTGRTEVFTKGLFLAAIPVLIIQISFAVGLGILTGTLNVFFRDVGQFMGIVLTFWMWATPIIYPIKALPEWFRPYVEMNPTTQIAKAYQNIFAFNQWPQWASLIWVAVLAFGLLFFGYWVYRKLSPQIVDEL